MNGTILSNFLLCKNGSVKILQNFAKLNSLPKFGEFVPINFVKNGSGEISQNFAKLNSLPKFREIRTYKICEKR
jgi:hypothetical protein